MGPETAAVISLGMNLIGGAKKAQASRETGVYNAAVLRRKARLEKENAARVAGAGREAAQDADFEAASVLGDVLAAQGGSGFDVTSGSSRARRGKIRSTAATNRKRIVEDADLQAASSLERARAAKLQAKDEIRKGKAGVASAIIGMGTDLIGYANLTTENKLKRLQQDTSSLRTRT